PSYGYRACASHSPGGSSPSGCSQRASPRFPGAVSLADELDNLPLTGAQEGPLFATLDDTVGEQASDGGREVAVAAGRIPTSLTSTSAFQRARMSRACSAEAASRTSAPQDASKFPTASFESGSSSTSRIRSPSSRCRGPFPATPAVGWRRSASPALRPI